jgi:Coenzyme PQQ synthesis protein D (PqqD)
MRNEPLARSADLIVDSIGDELLVYDTRNSRAHSLNNVGAAVWQACDGTRTLEEIAEFTGVDPAAVELALDNLADIELISGHERIGISRRTALRRITVGAAGLAIALPVIRSITAPTAAMAYGMSGQACTTQEFCGTGSYCSAFGLCHTGTGKASGEHCSHTSSCLKGAICLASSKCD